MSAINPLLEDDSIITLYLEQNWPIRNEHVPQLAAHVNRDIGVGSDFVNVYTRDVRIARKATAWLNSHGYSVIEIAA